MREKVHGDPKEHTIKWKHVHIFKLKRVSSGNVYGIEFYTPNITNIVKWT
jgi:hypothetical protein